ncbi:MAG: bifunctional UDP-N-acetylglucosamine diphosphorylase/glucosamine-1-phosphate N-acetyltransferase GlmU [Deltaproteobacteria bacterium]|nr:bifunctional UDP-N-acetylglucosamine diphosphorylase/glucosamine-1-phosphate N-acetyltransferase GlmU [Deltaproteobacteria bacterium]
MPTESPARWSAIVLAAGEGTRMKSKRPKVLHEIAGRALVCWVVEAALDAGASRCLVVVGHGRGDVERVLSTRFGERVEMVLQAEQRGTGDAVRCAIEADASLEGRVLVVYGDCPLIPAAVLRNLVEDSDRAEADLGLVTATLSDPSGYGRIVRNATGRVHRVVEERDCSAEERSIDEVNPGLYAVRAGFLREAITSLTPDNVQAELYLTDLVALAAERGKVLDLEGDMTELTGVNDQRDLALASATRHRRMAEELARSGVQIASLDALYVDAECEIEPGAWLGANVHLRGRCLVRAGARIDVGCVLTNVVVDRDANVLPYTVATDSSIGEGAQVGPFSHLRPDTRLGPRSKVGNFSETKKTTLGAGSKVNHLSYVGNGEIGERVNIGAGTIFCNYDGEQKHTTVLEDGVFIGSGTQLVAPVTVGRGAYVASGTTVTEDVPADALAISRTKQENKKGYAARLRARLRRKKKP